jgi:hypothetical protein
MNDQLEMTVGRAPEVVQPETATAGILAVDSISPPAPAAVEAEVPNTKGVAVEASNVVAEPGRHSRAGSKGARRIHQLIQEGRLYEQEHGLKRGRQRLRQLIELGKLYEQEHGLRPARASRGRERLSRMGREELLATLFRCLMRLAKPSFRGELARLADMLAHESNGHVA